MLRKPLDLRKRRLYVMEPSLTSLAIHKRANAFREKADPCQEFFAFSMSSSLFLQFSQAASVATLPSALVVDQQARWPRGHYSDSRPGGAYFAMDAQAYPARDDAVEAIGHDAR